MQVKRPGFSTGPEQGVIVSKGDGATGWDVGQGLGCVSSQRLSPLPLAGWLPPSLHFYWPPPVPEAETGASGAGRSYEGFCRDQGMPRPCSSSVPRAYQRQLGAKPCPS